jgi:hypothetical protein
LVILLLDRAELILNVVKSVSSVGAGTTTIVLTVGAFVVALG